jgi:Tfp pilus assembly protein PilF
MVKKAIELMPGTASFEDTYGWILYQRGNYQEALIWIQKAMDKSPSPDVADHLGDVYYKLGNTAKAVEFWKKAKELGIQGQTIENKIKNERL